jgi:hypothetical protein
MRTRPEDPIGNSAGPYGTFSGIVNFVVERTVFEKICLQKSGDCYFQFDRQVFVLAWK